MCGVVFPLLQHGYPHGLAMDWLLCSASWCIDILLVSVQYATITRDSQYVLRNGLDEATATAREVPKCCLAFSFLPLS
jgi:hypothetical protein